MKKLILIIIQLAGIYSNITICAVLTANKENNVTNKESSKKESDLESKKSTADVKTVHKEEIKINPDELLQKTIDVIVTQNKIDEDIFNSIKKALDAGANVNTVYQGTPILIQIIYLLSEDGQDTTDKIIERIVELFLEHGANVNSLDENIGHFPLTIAAYRGNANIVKQLLKKRANVNSVMEKDWKKRNPLLFAVESDSNQAIEVIEDLLKNSANINAQDSQGLTALANAVQRKDIKLVEFLLKNNADPNIPDANGNSLLFNISYSIYRQLKDALEKYSKDSPQYNDLEQSLLAIDFPLIRLLLENNARPDKKFLNYIFLPGNESLRRLFADFLKMPVLTEYKNIEHYRRPYK